MLRRMKDLKGFAIGARDGDIGKVSDFIFDDKAWTVRYLVVDTGRWLSGRNVLISPIIIDRVDWEGKRLPVLLTQEQVKNSPDISMNEEVSSNFPPSFLAQQSSINDAKDVRETSKS